MATIAHTVTARKRRPCDDYPTRHFIEPGDSYVRHVAFPGDSDIGNDGFWVLRICQECQVQYGQPMPPRRQRRVARQGGDSGCS